MGATGSSGVIAVTSPITNSGTSSSATIGIDQTGLTVAQSQVTNLVTDLDAKAANTTLIGNSHNLSNAVFTMDRSGTLASFSNTSGVLWLTAFTAVSSFSATQITLGTGAASSGLTTARMGLYSVNASNVATLVAETANDTTLFTSAGAIYTRSFSTARGLPASYSIVAGQRYAFGLIIIGTTMGSFWGGFSNSTAVTTFRGMSPAVSHGVSGQTDLTTPITITGTSVTILARVS
jgi:hypothetical protein